MRYILGVLVLLVVVCAIGVFFVEEGFDNENTMTALDYYKSVASQNTSSDISGSDISGSDVSGVPASALQPTASSVPNSIPSKNAKVNPDGSSSAQSSPGLADLASVIASPALVQGQVYDASSPIMNDDGRYASPSQLMPGDNSFVPLPEDDDDDNDDNDEGHVAVRVNRKDKCPDMSQYIRKDAIPCWGCKL